VTTVAAGQGARFARPRPTGYRRNFRGEGRRTGEQMRGEKRGPPTPRSGRKKKRPGGLGGGRSFGGGTQPVPGRNDFSVRAVDPDGCGVRESTLFDVRGSRGRSILNSSRHPAGLGGKQHDPGRRGKAASRTVVGDEDDFRFFRSWPDGAAKFGPVKAARGSGTSQGGEAVPSMKQESRGMGGEGPRARATRCFIPAGKLVHGRPGLEFFQGRPA